MKPLLKWAGGKYRLLKVLSRFFPPRFNAYHEPFLGSGAVFFSLRPKRAVLIDRNPDLVNFYRVVRSCPLDLMRKVDRHRVEREYFYRVRKRRPSDPVERAAWFLYLNKTAYNGLWRVNSKGEFNVPFGNYERVKFYDRDRLLEASALLRNALLLCGDFSLVLEHAKEGDFVYFDPPYPDAFCEYTPEAFDLRDHLRLREVFRTLDERNVFVMLSVPDSDFFRNLYRHYNLFEVLAPRSINCRPEGRKRKRELVITNYDPYPDTDRDGSKRSTCTPIPTGGLSSP